jgi:hypothetical protein
MKGCLFCSGFYYRETAFLAQDVIKNIQYVVFYT